MQYLGGKCRIGKQIGAFLNDLRKVGQPYWEPFVGAGWVLIHINAESNWASDIHYELIKMWRAVQEGWIPPTVVTEDEYAKAKVGLCTPELTAFIGFGCSWGGKYFGGYARNVKKRNYALSAHSSILRKIALLPPTIFLSGDYFSFTTPEPNMLIYCDPPYADTTKYSMKFDSEKFWERCRYFQSLGHTVVVSEYKAPRDFKCVLEIPTTTRYRDKKGQTIHRIERLFMYKDTKKG